MIATKIFYIRGCHRDPDPVIPLRYSANMGRPSLRCIGIQPSTLVSLSVHGQILEVRCGGSLPLTDYG